MPSFEDKRNIDNIDGFNPSSKTEDNLWVSILGEVLSSSQTKSPTSKSLLVLGDNESGKTTLIAKGQGINDPRKGSGLEYLYINVKDEYGEEQTRLGAWIVDGDLHYRGLLKFALAEQNFEHSLVLLVASLAKPWDIMETLQRWSEVLTTHVHRLKLARDYRKERQDSMIRHFQEYVEPVLGSSATSSTSATTGVNSRRGQSVSDTNEAVILPLGDHILVENLGIPIVVVLTKSDEMIEVERNYDYVLQHWDFIQQHIRKFCLKFGAALFYTSAKENKNVTLLFKYLTHRIYGFSFNEPACIVEKDALFIPTGWDTEQKISILYEGLTLMRPNDKFNDIIRPPMIRNPIQRESEITSEDEQIFLMKLQSILTKQVIDTSQKGSPQGRTTPTSAMGGSSKVTPTRANPAATAIIASGMQSKKPDSKNAAATDTGVLANFFNSLLSKKPTDMKTPTASGDSMQIDRSPDGS